LQDIGILAMRTALGKEYEQAVQYAADHDALLAAERTAFGCGHEEVGYWLLKRWRLPEHLALACLASHAPVRMGEGKSTNACVALSGYLADMFMAPDSAEAAARLSDAASRCLQLDASGLADVVDAMRNGITEVEDLFDVPLIDAAQSDALLGEAKELLLIANLRQTRELEERSQRDALTGAHNRAYVDDALEKEFQLSVRHGWPLSVAMIDIDHFKQVNDTYGHAVGDAALQTVTRVIQAQIRSGDVFARYGGEEFVLLFPGTPLAEAARVLERIRSAIAAVCHVDRAMAAFNVTISIWLACHVAQQESYNSAHDLMQAADAALYDAKAAGRNQLVKADSATYK
jgi:diguanylate cyclase (GGDEF)-like protein